MNSVHALIWLYEILATVEISPRARAEKLAVLLTPEDWDELGQVPEGPAKLYGIHCELGVYLVNRPAGEPRINWRQWNTIMLQYAEVQNVRRD